MGETHERVKDAPRFEERFCPACGGRHQARVRPAYQFYPGDEERKTALRLVSLAAYGLWHRMLNLMHAAVPRGWLVGANSKAIEPPELARLVGESPATIKKLLVELEGHGIFSRTQSGIIYSRRMVRDEHVSNVRAEAGSKGGNPSLTATEGSDLVKQNGDLLNQTGKQNPTPAPSPALAPSADSAASATARARATAIETQLPDGYQYHVGEILHDARDAAADWLGVMENALKAGLRPESLAVALNDWYMNHEHIEPKLDHFVGYLRKQRQVQDAMAASRGNGTRPKAGARERHDAR